LCFDAGNRQLGIAQLTIAYPSYQGQTRCPMFATMIHHSAAVAIFLVADFDNFGEPR
jgi:hypothetical protein